MGTPGARAKLPAFAPSGQMEDGVTVVRMGHCEYGVYRRGAMLGCSAKRFSAGGH